jgi:predicted ATPase
MLITRIELRNWRNFKAASIDPSAGVTYLVGPNASGKSNFLDALRFLRDIAKPIGGGLQTALIERGGFSKVRCHHTYGPKAVGGTDLWIKVSARDENTDWTYELSVNYPKVGSREFAHVSREIVRKDGAEILVRPSETERQDPEQLKVSYLEQAAQNSQFREIATFFSGITYVHLVPQLVKYGERIAGRLLPDDPFGQAFMKRIADTSPKTRDNRLNKVANALSHIVPGLEKLNFVKDKEGRPHIEMGFRTFRPQNSKQLEDQLSDGTLRLIALLWLLQERHASPLLLEEPELSLNEEIVRQLHTVFSRISRKFRNQVFVTTHSSALLSNPGIPAESVFTIALRKEGGSEVAPPSEQAKIAMRNGIPASEVVLDRSAQLVLDV